MFKHLSILIVFLAAFICSPIKNTTNLPGCQVAQAAYISPQYINIKAFPYFAVGDGVADDTPAIQAAIDNSSTGSPAYFRPIYFPAGNYRCAEIQWNGATSFIGAEVDGTRLVYNGNGADGSTIIDCPNAAGSIPFAGFYNITFDGYNPTGGTIVDNMLTGSLGVDLDWGFKIENCYFNNCFGDAINFDSSIIFNLHINRIRWGAVGGYCIALSAESGSENRPVTINQFTYDNNIHTGAATAAINQGKYDGTHWGKGILKVDGAGGGCSFTLSNARVEFNTSLILDDTRKAMVFIDTPVTVIVNLIGIYGYFVQFDAGVVLYSKTGKIDFSYTNCNIDNVSAIFEDAANEKYVPEFTKNMLYLENQQRDQGVTIGINRLEMRTTSPGLGVYARNQVGDITLHSDGAIGDPVGWYVTGPTTGISVPAGGNLTTNADVNSGNADIVIGTPNNLYKLGVGTAVTIVGAGVAAADLDTYITANDSSTDTITVNDTPSTSVDPATISIQQPTSTPFGTIGGVQIAAQVDSVAADVATLKADFNALLAKMRTSNLLDN